MISPIPFAMPGPVVAQRSGTEDITTEGVPIANPNLSSSGQTNQTFTDTGNQNNNPAPNMLPGFVPSGQQFVITSATISNWASTSGTPTTLNLKTIDAFGNKVTLASYVGGNGTFSGTPITIDAGLNIFTSVSGGNNTFSWTGTIVGYYQSAAGGGTPGGFTQIINPDVD